MPDHPEKNLKSAGAAIPQTKSKQARRAEKGTTPKTGALNGSQPTSPIIGASFSDRGFHKAGGGGSSHFP